jgi:hypothetical protein
LNSGTVSFTYQVSDGVTTSNIATVSIQVLPTNQRPVAQNDTFTATEDLPLVAGGKGVLANDNDPDNDPIFAILQTGPASAANFTLSPTGAFTSSPAGNFSGIDSFTYRASDGSGSSDVATVTLSVLAVNDAPTFALSQSSLTRLDTVGAQTITNFVTGMSPGGGTSEATQTLTLTVSGNTNPGMFSGPVTVSANGTLNFNVAPNVEGNATITVQLQDSGGTAIGGVDTNTQTFVINIQHPHRWHNSLPPQSGQKTGGMEVLYEDVPVDKHSITATDVLLIINYLNSTLPKFIPITAQLGNGGVGTPSQPFYDVDGDDNVTATDALLIINTLNAGLGGALNGEGEGSGGSAGGEGEASQADAFFFNLGASQMASTSSSQPASQPQQQQTPPQVQSPAMTDLISALAADAAEEALKKRRLG